jgi:hypothetical protein
VGSVGRDDDDNVGTICADAFGRAQCRRMIMYAGEDACLEPRILPSDKSFF